MSRPNNETNAS